MVASKTEMVALLPWTVASPHASLSKPAAGVRSAPSIASQRGQSCQPAMLLVVLLLLLQPHFTATAPPVASAAAVNSCDSIHRCSECVFDSTDGLMPPELYCGWCDSSQTCVELNSTLLILYQQLAASEALTANDSSPTGSTAAPLLGCADMRTSVYHSHCPDMSCSAATRTNNIYACRPSTIVALVFASILAVINSVVYLWLQTLKEKPWKYEPQLSRLFHHHHHDASRAEPLSERVIRRWSCPEAQTSPSRHGVAAEVEMAQSDTNAAPGVPIHSPLYMGDRDPASAAGSRLLQSTSAVLRPLASSSTTSSSSRSCSSRRTEGNTPRSSASYSTSVATTTPAAAVASPPAGEQDSGAAAGDTGDSSPHGRSQLSLSACCNLNRQAAADLCKACLLCHSRQLMPFGPGDICYWCRLRRLTFFALAVGTWSSLAVLILSFAVALKPWFSDGFYAEVLSVAYAAYGYLAWHVFFHRYYRSRQWRIGDSAPTESGGIGARGDRCTPSTMPSPPTANSAAAAPNLARPYTAVTTCYARLTWHLRGRALLKVFPGLAPEAVQEERDTPTAVLPPPPTPHAAAPANTTSSATTAGADPSTTPSLSLQPSTHKKDPTGSTADGSTSPQLLSTAMTLNPSVAVPRPLLSSQTSPEVLAVAAIATTSTSNNTAAATAAGSGTMKVGAQPMCRRLPGAVMQQKSVETAQLLCMDFIAPQYRKAMHSVLYRGEVILWIAKPPRRQVLLDVDCLLVSLCVGMGFGVWLLALSSVKDTTYAIVRLSGSTPVAVCGILFVVVFALLLLMLLRSSHRMYILTNERLITIYEGIVTPVITATELPVIKFATVYGYRHFLTGTPLTTFSWEIPASERRMPIIRSHRLSGLVSFGELLDYFTAISPAEVGQVDCLSRGAQMEQREWRVNSFLCIGFYTVLPIITIYPYAVPVFLAICLYALLLVLMLAMLLRGYHAQGTTIIPLNVAAAWATLTGPSLHPSNDATHAMVGPHLPPSPQQKQHHHRHQGLTLGSGGAAATASAAPDAATPPFLVSSSVAKAGQHPPFHLDSSELKTLQSPQATAVEVAADSSTAPFIVSTSRSAASLSSPPLLTVIPAAMPEATNPIITSGAPVAVEQQRDGLSREAGSRRLTAGLSSGTTAEEHGAAVTVSPSRKLNAPPHFNSLILQWTSVAPDREQGSSLPSTSQVEHPPSSASRSTSSVNHPRPHSSTTAARSAAREAATTPPLVPPMATASQASHTTTNSAAAAAATAEPLLTSHVVAASSLSVQPTDSIRWGDQRRSS